VERVKQNMIKSGLVLAVLLVYVLVISTHIFYLPRITVYTSHNTNSIFKRKNENVQTTNGLDRIDRATFKNGTTTLIQGGGCIDVSSQPSELNFENNFQKIRLVNTNTFCQHRHIYLSCCVFRI